MEVDERDLPDDFRRGLQALRRTHPHQRFNPVIGKDNMVVVSLGWFRTGHLTEDTSGRDLDHVHDEYEAYVRLPRDFPRSGVKGFGTAPPMERRNHPVQNNPDWEPEVQAALNEYLDKEVEWYSWGWDGVPVSQPEDMKFAYDLADRMLRHA